MKRKTLLLFLMALSTIAYLLADRYLIDHVEIADVSAYAAAAETLPATASAATMSSASLPVSQGEAGLASAQSSVTAGDWNYRSDTLSIAITKVSTGSGNTALTYFVADVVLSSANQLSSAFAGDSFGRNIIAYTSAIAADNNAIFAINGDYYGFRTDGIEIHNGVIYRDKPARVGLAFYLDGTLKVYDETQTSAQELLDEGVWNTLSFGPALLEDGAVAANLAQVAIDTNFGNHSIQGDNPRTGAAQATVGGPA